MAVITGGGIDCRRRTAERPARMRMAARVPNAIRTAKRNPIPRSMIGSLITSPHPGRFRPARNDDPKDSRALMAAVAGRNIAGEEHQTTIHASKLKRHMYVCSIRDFF